MQWIITFPSVYHAFRARQILAKQGISVELISIPRQLSGCCEGLAAELAEADIEQAVAVLAANGVAMVKKGIRLDGKP